MKLKIKYKVTTDNFDKSFKKWIYLFSKDAFKLQYTVSVQNKSYYFELSTDKRILN